MTRTACDWVFETFVLVVNIFAIITTIVVLAIVIPLFVIMIVAAFLWDWFSYDSNPYTVAMRQREKLLQHTTCTKDES
jgi:hypothetical protein